MIAKKATATYWHGRSREWLKFKCSKGQEFVIGGFTRPGGSRPGFGALLLGYYDDGLLRYAGKVGTGFDEDFLRSFRDRLDKRRRESSPFDDALDEDAIWIRPTSSPRSASPSGRRPGGCGIRASSVCAATSRPKRSGVKYRGHHDDPKGEDGRARGGSI